MSGQGYPDGTAAGVDGYSEYKARFWPIGPHYDLWGYDEGLGSGGESEGWHYIGQFDARYEPLPEDCQIATPRGRRRNG